MYQTLTEDIRWILTADGRVDPAYIPELTRELSAYMSSIVRLVYVSGALQDRQQFRAIVGPNTHRFLSLRNAETQELPKL